MDYEKEFNDFLTAERHLAIMARKRTAGFGSGTALRHKPYGTWVSISWESLGEQLHAVSKGLLELGVGVQDMVGIFSQNRAEWIIADLGIQSVRGVSVPVYATNSTKEAEYIINDAGIKVMFVDGQEQYDRTMSLASSSSPLTKVIVFDKRVHLLYTGIDLYFDDLLELGRKSKLERAVQERLAQAPADDLATLIYTSGTTGDPKGAMLTHRNFLSMIFGSHKHFPGARSDERSLCLLPLSHVFERAWSYGIIYMGGENSFCPNPKELLEYFRETRPHYMCSVPRIWEKVYATIFDRLDSAPPSKKKLFHWAVETGGLMRDRKKAKGIISPVLALKYLAANLLVLRKLRALVGGKCVSFNVGGAPFSREINEFFDKAGIMLGQGYGLTEVFPVCVSSPWAGYKPGTCGPVIPLVKVRISIEGEIQVSGPNVMKGYYKKPEATAESFTADGWFRTGDVGHIDEDGYIVITDRIKDLIITAGGKNISPQNIETLLKEDLYIEQAVAIGDKRKYISALIVPSFEALESYAKSMNIPYGSREELIRRPEITDFYRARIDRQTTELGQVEQVKKFTLMPQEFTQEAGEITPTMKVKRKIINEYYNDLIDAMYA